MGQCANASAGFGTLGARLNHQWQVQETNWQASLSVGWQRAWGDRSPTTTLAFATGPDFTVSAAAIARNWAVIEVGIGASLGHSSRFNFVCSTTLANQSCQSESCLTQSTVPSHEARMALVRFTAH